MANNLSVLKWVESKSLLSARFLRLGGVEFALGFL